MKTIQEIKMETKAVQLKIVRAIIELIKNKDNESLYIDTYNTIVEAYVIGHITSKEWDKSMNIINRVFYK